jgi:hypothetical protein
VFVYSREGNELTTITVHRKSCMAAQRPTIPPDPGGKGTDVVPLRARSAGRGACDKSFVAEQSVVFDDAVGPGWLAAQWCDDDTVELALGAASATGSEVAFRLASTDVLDLVRMLVEGLNDSAPKRPAPPATVLPFATRPVTGRQIPIPPGT